MWFVEPEESFAALDNLLALCETFYQQARLLRRLATHLHSSWHFSTVSLPYRRQPRPALRRRKYALFATFSHQYQV